MIYSPGTTRAVDKTRSLEAPGVFLYEGAASRENVREWAAWCSEHARQAAPTPLTVYTRNRREARTILYEVTHRAAGRAVATNTGETFPGTAGGHPAFEPAVANQLTQTRHYPRNAC